MAAALSLDGMEPGRREEKNWETSLVAQGTDVRTREGQVSRRWRWGRGGGGETRKVRTPRTRTSLKVTDGGRGREAQKSDHATNSNSPKHQFCSNWQASVLEELAMCVRVCMVGGGRGQNPGLRKWKDRAKYLQTFRSLPHSMGRSRGAEEGLGDLGDNSR